MEENALITNARPIRTGSYFSPLRFCAERSPRKYITSDVANCVLYGFFCWLRPYNAMPLDNTPNRCQRGTAGGTFCVGRVVLLVTSTAFGLVVELVEVCRLARFVCGFENGGLRKAARPAAALVLNTSILTIVTEGA
jgi:hypothetical protein